MKVLLLFVAVLGLSSASTLFHESRNEIHPLPAHNKNLDDLLQQLISFIPFDKCKEIVDWYLANDADVKQAYTFLLSEEFKMLTDEVIAMPEYQDFLKYLYDAGVDIYTYQNIIRKIFGLPPISPPRIHLTTANRQTESGIVKMVLEVVGALPVADIKRWYYDTCLPDPAYQDLLVKLNSKEFRELVIRVKHTNEYQQMTNILKDQGIDVAAIEKAIADFFANTRMAPRRTLRTLESLLQQFIAFIPVDKLLNILITYIQTDPDVQAVFAYLQGQSFHDLVVKLEGVAELKDFLNWLVSKNIDAYTYINTVLDILGIPEIHPLRFPRFMNPKATSGLINMINDILAVLPVEDIKKWFTDTCEPDPEFQELLAQLRSDSFLVIVNTVRADPAFPEMVAGLQKLGVDTDAVHNFLHNYFGW